MGRMLIAFAAVFALAIPAFAADHKDGATKIEKKKDDRAPASAKKAKKKKK